MKKAFERLTVRAVHPYAWLWEPLEGEASFVLRAMFGARAAYLDGRLMLCFVARSEPWRGVLVCTTHDHHESLRREFPALVNHPVLAKWLYVRESANEFESVSQRLVALVRRRDPRIGVQPPPRRRKSSR